MNCRHVVILVVFICSAAAAADPALPGTRPLEMQGDIASAMIDGIDSFLLRELDASVAQRDLFWQRDYTSDHAYSVSVAGNRQHLARILGIGEREPTTQMSWDGTAIQPEPVGRSENYQIYRVRWRAFGDVWGEGLLLEPNSPIANVVAIPDADQTPEQIAGLAAGVPPVSQFARQLAARGCRVLVPVLISRERQLRAPPGHSGRAVLTNREYLYRPAFELGRHLIGYEIQKVMAGIDWFERVDRQHRLPVGIVGYGEGGLLALYSSALDQRVDMTCVSGYFGSRQAIWQEPIDRNIFGLLVRFGDAEIASLIAPRGLLVDPAGGPVREIPGEGGAPAALQRQSEGAVREEWQRLLTMVQRVPAIAGDPQRFGLRGLPAGDFCSPAVVASFVHQLCDTPTLAADQPPQVLVADLDVAARQTRQIRQIDEHTQRVLRESSYVREQFMSKLDTTSLAAYERSAEPYREYFREEVIGAFDRNLEAANPRSRIAYQEPTWTGYEVVLDVFPGVMAYGILCVPDGIAAGERRPVVVCQHGLEGRPQMVVAGDHRAYHDFAAKLAERGFVTFAPQNLYIFEDRFRTLQRKANPLQKTLFSIMVPQHQQIVDWLQSLPFVDPERVGFYGLSYGGKSAMRIPPLVSGYCLSICSADFNEWVRKCSSNRSRYSYVFTGEYEIFEWNLGSTFNYAEMAALIAPRPFMVERGHFDGVAPDEWVAAEYAKVRRLYQAQLGIGEATEIEWFVGPHTIHGQETFAFLHKHLRWPAQ